MCSSLTSTWKYIQSYINANQGDTFDTLILYGHGGPGSINMGTSKFTIGPSLDPADGGYANRKHGREIFGLDKPRTGEPLRVRSLDSATEGDFVANASTFFANGWFEVNEVTEFFHIFLMGCKVGAHENFSRLLAEKLAEVSGRPICVTAPMKKFTRAISMAFYWTPRIREKRSGIIQTLRFDRYMAITHCSRRRIGVLLCSQLGRRQPRRHAPQAGCGSATGAGSCRCCRNRSR